MPAITFHLHGNSAETDGISVDVQTDHAIDELRKTVAAKFSVALPTTVSFHKSAAPETTASDLEVLATVDSILKERTIAILVSGKKVSGLFISINEIHLISRTGPTHPRSHWRHPLHWRLQRDLSRFHRQLSAAATQVRPHCACFLPGEGLPSFVACIPKINLIQSIYLTDDPDCAGVVLSEGEFYSKEVS
jgi:hypothetical protein